jgi:hypothetical protein
MKFKKLLLATMLASSSSAFAGDDLQYVEAGTYLGGGITKAGTIRIQQEVSSGGYTFLEARTETVEPYTSGSFTFGLGITDIVDSESLFTKLNLDVGYIMENITRDEDLANPDEDTSTKHRGLVYSFGSETTLKKYPAYGILFEVKHLGSPQVLETNTLIGAGISYKYKDFKIKAKYYQEGWGQLSVSYYY